MSKSCSSMILLPHTEPCLSRPIGVSAARDKASASCMYASSECRRVRIVTRGLVLLSGQDPSVPVACAKAQILQISICTEVICSDVPEAEGVYKEGNEGAFVHGAFE